MQQVVMATRSAEAVHASRCENCHSRHETLRRREVTEAGTGQSAARFLCALCAGGMKQIGHSVAPFSRVDQLAYAAWLDTPSLGIAAPPRLQEMP